VGTIERNQLTLAVLVPAKNEAGHLREVVQSILKLPDIHEIIIIEGGSTDTTWQEAKTLASENSGLVVLIKQSSVGKFNAVLEGAASSKSEFLFIWDSDGTVSWDDNFQILNSKFDEYTCVVGDRLNGNIHPGAMRRANFFGNHLFSVLWMPLLGFRKLDLLCGSKLFPRSVFQSIPRILSRIDPYGDFSLIATALLSGLKIQAVTVDYFPRVYGVTQIKRWRGGVRLLIATLLTYTLFAFKYLTKVFPLNAQSVGTKLFNPDA